MIKNIIKPGYHSENAFWMKNRQQTWQGFGKEIDGSELNANDYVGKFFLKLVEEPVEPVAFVFTIRSLKKSDQSKV